MGRPVEVRWADGTYSFRLPIGQLRELQEKTSCGPLELLRRLQGDRWRLDDVRETLRLGLIGGGLKPPDASRLVEKYVDERPLAESVPPAQLVLMTLLFGDLAAEMAEKDAKSGEPEARGSQSDRAAGSPSRTSTASAH